MRYRVGGSNCTERQPPTAQVESTVTAAAVQSKRDEGRAARTSDLEAALFDSQMSGHASMFEARSELVSGAPESAQPASESAVTADDSWVGRIPLSQFTRPRLCRRVDVTIDPGRRLRFGAPHPRKSRPEAMRFSTHESLTNKSVKNSSERHTSSCRR